MYRARVTVPVVLDGRELMTYAMPMLKVGVHMIIKALHIQCLCVLVCSLSGVA